MRLIFISLFGLEKCVALELEQLGFLKERLHCLDGRVCYDLLPSDDWSTISRLLSLSNLFLGACERIYWELANEKVHNFDALFELTSNLKWENFYKHNAKILVSAYSRDSQLSSVPALQSIVKKAIIKRLLNAQGKAAATLLQENGKASLGVQVALDHDQLSLRVDSSIVPLHKRGYRLAGALAPLKESLAYGILSLLHWPKNGGAALAYANKFVKEAAPLNAEVPSLNAASSAINPSSLTSASSLVSKQEALIDLFAGSGTFAIEAAWRYLNLAPNLTQKFGCLDWPSFDLKEFNTIKEQAWQLVEERFLELAKQKQAASIKQSAKLEQLENIEQLEQLGHLGAVPTDLMSLSSKLEQALSLNFFPIYAADINQEVLNLAKANAKRAGIAALIHWQCKAAEKVDFDQLKKRLNSERLLLLSNPPYGERLGEIKQLKRLFKTLGEQLFADAKGQLVAGLRFAFLQADQTVMREIGFKADKQRKLYNGNLQCYLYQYYKRAPHLAFKAPKRTSDKSSLKAAGERRVTIVKAKP